MAELSELGWSAKLTLEVKGPKEGPVVVTVDYVATTRDVAVGLQNALASMAIELNKNGIPE